MFSLLGKLRNEKLGLKEVTLESLKSVLIDNLQEFINLRRDDASILSEFKELISEMAQIAR